MIRKLVRYAALAAVVGIGACEEALIVENPNQPPTEKVLGTPADAEALIGSYLKRWHVGVYGGTSRAEARLNIWSLNNFSSLANNCQNTSYPFSTNFINNQPGAGCTGEHNGMYIVLAEVNRVASSFLRLLNATPPLDLGSPARNGRARAFAEFLNAMSLGYIALFHDQAAVISADTDPLDPGELVAHTVLADAAYAAFARAIALAEDPANTAPDGFPLPAEWFPTPAGGMTAADFVKVMRSYRARIRANMARNPTERAAVLWADVIADAAAGVTADHEIITGTNIGGFSGLAWRQQYNSFSTWHQMSPFFIGMADNSGSYAAWIAQPLGDRGAGNVSFFMTTPDLRFPQAGTRTLQQAEFGISSCETAGTPCRRYFVNRPSGNDQNSGVGWGWSNYDFARYRSWHIAGDAGVARQGRAPVLTIAELDLLRAEGLYRQGDFQGAATLVNKTRTAPMSGTPPVAKGGGLPAITSFDDVTPVPGGNDCVPKVPVGPAFTTIACGNLFEALKWEKRMETAFTHHAAWYLDSRGWGDLPEGTPLFLPVPFGDWQARGLPSSGIYSTGAGPTVPNSAAARSNYGW